MESEFVDTAKTEETTREATSEEELEEKYEVKEKKYIPIMRKYWDAKEKGDEEKKKDAIEEMCNLLKAYIKYKIYRLTPAAMKSKELLEDLEAECYRLIVETIDIYDGVRSPTTFWDTRLVGVINNYNLKERGLKPNDQTIRNKMKAAYNQLQEMGIEPSLDLIRRYTDDRITFEVINKNLKKYERASEQIRLDKPVEGGGYLLDAYFSNQTTPETEYIKQEKKDAVNKALDTLPDDEKMIIYLNMYKEVNLETIAKTMGISISSVKNKRATALRRLSTNADLQRINGTNELSKDYNEITFLEDDEISLDDFSILDDIFEENKLDENSYIPMYENSDEYDDDFEFELNIL